MGGMFDKVNRPAHYCEGRRYEPLDVIEDWKLSYHAGTALKYISRAGRKDDEIEDLRKAVVYLNRRIDMLVAGQKADGSPHDTSRGED